MGVYVASLVNQIAQFIHTSQGCRLVLGKRTRGLRLSVRYANIAIWG